MRSAGPEPQSRARGRGGREEKERKTKGGGGRETTSEGKKRPQQDPHRRPTLATWGKLDISLNRPRVAGTGLQNGDLPAAAAMLTTGLARPHVGRAQRLSTLGISQRERRKRAGRHRGRRHAGSRWRWCLGARARGRVRTAGPCARGRPCPDETRGNMRRSQRWRPERLRLRRGNERRRR